MGWVIFVIVELVCLLFNGGVIVSSIIAFVVGLVFCIATEMSFWLFILIYAATVFVLIFLSKYINTTNMNLRELARDIMEAVDSHKEIGELNKISIGFSGVDIEGRESRVQNIIEYRIEGEGGNDKKKLKYVAEYVYKQMDKETFDLVNHIGAGSYETGRVVVEQRENTIYAEPERRYYSTGSMDIVRRTWYSKEHPNYNVPQQNKTVKRY